jgi:phosphomannomutase/phosphomannomutase/phosphoglucomutase
MTEYLACFKAYDIRGRVPDELDAELAFRIGQAFAVCFKPQRMAIGHDIRLSGPSLAGALAEGFLAAGVDVVDLGLCGTEEIYFAAFNLEVDGGIIVTASHNPADYNGMKLVRKGAVPVSGDTGLRDIERLAAAGFKAAPAGRGRLTKINNQRAYIDHLLTYVEPAALKPLKIVVNAGNGCAGPVIDLLESALPFAFVKLCHEPDGTFPNGVPNPLLPENRAITSRAVLEHGADLGLAWDGDFDRCFFFDEKGAFVEGYYIVGLLAQAMLAKTPGAKIIHDPRLVWNTRELVARAGGEAVMSKTGHAFIKERMRAEDALYGGEMSAHHYFREFAYCDSGMIPWLLVAELVSRTGRRLSELMADRQAAFPVSGEINRRVVDPDAVLARIEEAFIQECPDRDYTDGLSMSCGKYRFNVRKSNTEPLLRLNVESRGDRELMERKTGELLGIIDEK